MGPEEYRANVIKLADDVIAGEVDHDAASARFETLTASLVVPPADPA